VKHVNNPQGGRILAADQVFGTLAQRLSAPCPAVCVAEIPQSLIDAGALTYQDGTTRLQAGPAHASLTITRPCVDQPPSTEVQQAAENKERLARLVVMYTWFAPGDLQWVCETGQPRLVHSVDHGFHLPGDQSWSAASLAQASTIAEVNPFPDARLTEGDFRGAFSGLEELDESEIAAAVGRVPAAWGVSLDDLEALARWLWERYVQLRARLGPA